MIPHPGTIPRRAFFADGAKEAFRISGGGRYVSYLSGGRLEKEIWVAPRTDPRGARRVAVVDGACFLDYSWAWTDDLLVACWRVANSARVKIRRIEVGSGRVVPLDCDGLGLAYLSDSPRLPGEVTVLGYREDNVVPDVYRLCCRTGVAQPAAEEHERLRRLPLRRSSASDAWPASGAERLRSVPPRR